MPTRCLGLLLCGFLVACAGAARGPSERIANIDDSARASVPATRWRSSIESYVPSVRADNQTALNMARRAFAGYMNAIHERIHPLFADTLLALDGMPAGHPLNDRRLRTEIEIVLNRESGGIVRMGVTNSSGITSFDAAVLDAVMRAAPFGTPPPEIVSPDGHVYLHWEFHRNKEACSTFNARPFLLKAQPDSFQRDDPDRQGLRDRTDAWRHAGAGALSASRRRSCRFASSRALFLRDRD